MNEFQILDDKGSAIPINKLDEIAAKFWGVELQDKRYAVPESRDKYPEGIEGDMNYLMQISWYDCIGFKIAHPTSNWTKGWENVVNSLLSDISTSFIKGDTEEIEIVQYDGTVDDFGKLPDDVTLSIFVKLQWAKPYVELINHFHSLGFKPSQLKQ